MSFLSDTERSVLRTLCDTVVPAIDRPDDSYGFWARKASDLGVETALELLLSTAPPEQQAGIAMLLDGLGQLGLAPAASQASREQIVRAVSPAWAPRSSRAARTAPRSLPTRKPCMARQSARFRHAPRRKVRVAKSVVQAGQRKKPCEAWLL
jgi:hypothetical protein